MFWVIPRSGQRLLHLAGMSCQRYNWEAIPTKKFGSPLCVSNPKQQEAFCKCTRSSRRQFPAISAGAVDASVQFRP
jgi:hypothetical protein